jgi:hypothetical protein
MKKTTGLLQISIYLLKKYTDDWNKLKGRTLQKENKKTRKLAKKLLQNEGNGEEDGVKACREGERIDEEDVKMLEASIR